MSNFAFALAAARGRMVETQIARRGVDDPAVLEAMRSTPRESFVPDEQQEQAFQDEPLPIGSGQTISQPYIVALMAQAAKIGAEDSVLEVGTGSGYAAAVLSALAERVHTIERRPELARAAQARLARLGYANVEVREGDGEAGWPEAQPFDAILLAAGAREVPPALRAQLKIGGRLIAPIGETRNGQQLMKITRTGPDEYAEESLGPVHFVPLIGEHGWAEEPSASAPTPSLPALIRAAAEPLPPMEDPAFAAAFDRFAGARVVLLGEASHGTAEFYRARAAITRRLVERHGFSIVAVEADWPDAAVIDRHVRQKAPRVDGEPAFRRFPTWMWRNTEVDAFVDWLAAYNAKLEPDARTGFYGLDLYNLTDSIRAVIDYLDRVDPEAARAARQRYGCLAPWQDEPQSYGRMTLSAGYNLCQKPVVAMLKTLLERRLEYSAEDGAAFLDAAQNARLVRDAEAYYRAMYEGAAESWNVRDRHMFDTLCNLLDAKGDGSKVVVWAHNSHIGDARYTEMGVRREELNIGQLCRERFGDAAALIGFGTHTGTVACASDWDEPMEVKRVLSSRDDSYERLWHDAGVSPSLTDLREGVHPDLRQALLEPRLERFIGVIYRPETERWSHYSEATLPRQFDAWVWFDETEAVTPLPTRTRPGAEETYPFGL